MRWTTIRTSLASYVFPSNSFKRRGSTSFFSLAFLCASMVMGRSFSNINFRSSAYVCITKRQHARFDPSVLPSDTNPMLNDTIPVAPSLLYGSVSLSLGLCLCLSRPRTTALPADSDGGRRDPRAQGPLQTDDPAAHPAPALAPPPTQMTPTPPQAPALVVAAAAMRAAKVAAIRPTTGSAVENSTPWTRIPRA